MKSASDLVSRLHRRMTEAAGPLNWWPADPQGANAGRDEIIIGAVLVQNTAWTNVERALASLNRAGMLSLRRLALSTPELIAPLIRASGCFNLKARRLHAVSHFFAPEGKERWNELAETPDDALRLALLNVYGIGRETADAILLYALDRAVFVVDAYALRIGVRHGLFAPGAGYEQARDYFMRHAVSDRAHYNEYHALLVWVGNRFCRPNPRCAACPLSGRDCFASRAAWRAQSGLLTAPRAPRRRSVSVSKGISP